MARPKSITQGEPTLNHLELKLKRLEQGGSPRILDLFSGCGGFMAGFQRAGCISLGGVEIDELAASSYASNFRHDTSRDFFQAHASSKDIQSLDPDRLLKS
ncbi:MAG: hypothetical protein DMF53_24495, partial [Acidobacteria bacterium]